MVKRGFFWLVLSSLIYTPSFQGRKRGESRRVASMMVSSVLQVSPSCTPSSSASSSCAPTPFLSTPRGLLPWNANVTAHPSSKRHFRSVVCACDSGSLPPLSVSRRELTSLAAGILFLTSTASLPARADIEEEYKVETQTVMEKVRSTLSLEKTDPSMGTAVKSLRQASNDWVAKYRREKRFAGKPSFSNMYSVLNAVSGHYISYGEGTPLPAKRKNQILDEIKTAEKALIRGR